MSYKSRSSKRAHHTYTSLTIMRVFILAVILTAGIAAVNVFSNVQFEPPATYTAGNASPEPHKDTEGGRNLLLLFAAGVFAVFASAVLSGMEKSSREHSTHKTLVAGEPDVEAATIFDAYNQVCRGTDPDKPMTVALYGRGDLNQYPSHLQGQGEWETLFVQLPYLLENQSRASRLGITLQFSRKDVRIAQKKFYQATQLPRYKIHAPGRVERIDPKEQEVVDDGFLLSGVPKPRSRR
jgi:hypothetical protein